MSGSTRTVASNVFWLLCGGVVWIEENEYDENGEYKYPEGFDPETQEWKEGFETQREQWEQEYAAAQERRKKRVGK